MEAVIDTIIDQARTGEIGDGKIFGMWSYKYLFICFIYLRFVYVVAEILHNTENWISWNTVWRIFLTIRFEVTSCFVLVGAVSPVSDVIRIRTGTAWTSASITPVLFVFILFWIFGWLHHQNAAQFTFLFLRNVVNLVSDAFGSGERGLKAERMAGGRADMQVSVDGTDGVWEKHPRFCKGN